MPTITTFRVEGVLGLASGEVQVAALYDPAGVIAAILSLSESPATSKQYGGSGTFSLSDALSLPYEYEVRSCTAATQAGFTNSAAVRRTRGSYTDLGGGYLASGVWYPYAGANSSSLTVQAIDDQLSGTHGSGAWGGSAGGAGPNAATTHVWDGTNNLAGASLTFTGAMSPIPSGQSDANGLSNFGLQNGTYRVSVWLGGYLPYSGTAGVSGTNYTIAAPASVSGTTITIPLTASVLPAAGAGQVTGQLYTYDGQGALAGGAQVDFELVKYYGTNANSFSREVFTLTSSTNGSGLLAGAFEQNCGYRGRRLSASGHGGWVSFDTPTNSTTFNLPPILGFLGI